MTYVRTDKVNGRYKYVHELKCKQCTASYERVSGNKSPLKQGWCSESCRTEWYKNQNWTKLICKGCSSEFEVYNHQKDYKFCSYACYHRDMKDNPEQYGLYDKAVRAQASSNTPESIEKMRETKLANGLMIDWKDATWKQYWKKCDELTRKMRSVLLEKWDGRDYITGDYKKDNLNLHYSHGDYPTLDHVISKTECYKQGLTPQQACSAENLRWTTRRNNSSKYNKVAK